MQSLPHDNKSVFVSDCEGPISKNDNAFEIVSHFIPNGNQLFTLISRYDDVLAYVVKRLAYKAGDTLKLILPFLKAYDVNDRALVSFSLKNVLLVPAVKDAINFIRGIMPSFIVSTSYEQYMNALCDLIEFPFNHVYCTRLSLDKLKITAKEKQRLKEITKELLGMPELEIPQNAETLDDMPTSHQETMKKMDRVFWEEIPNMHVGELFSQVNPIGGFEKAKAIQDILSKLAVTLKDVMYVGDSITDLEAFELVRKGGGLTISFNGNEYAVRAAEIAVMSENAIITAMLAEAFKSSKEEVIEFVNNMEKFNLNQSALTPVLKNKFMQLHPRELPVVEFVNSDNRERLVKQSSSFRKRVRGEAVGKLG
jgi:energy-converting hydrogenase A subunit R